MSERYTRQSLARNVIATSAICAGIVGADKVRHYHVAPKQLCGVPPADYQPPHPPPAVVPVIAISGLGQILTPPATLASATAAMSLKVPVQTTPRIKLFQFNQSTLQVDHCSISRMALTIQDNGLWRLSLQGDQNPVVEISTGLTTVQPSSTLNVGLPAPGKPPLPTAPIRGLPAVRLKNTNHLKRNLFVVRVRGLGAYTEPIPVPATPSIVGKPVLLDLEPIEFWVQNGVPYPLVAEAEHPYPDVQRFFDLIDRVEIEFSYR
jgi:hypothetical protein